MEEQTEIPMLPRLEPTEFEDISAKIGRIRKALDENLDKLADPKDIEKTYKSHVDEFLEAKANGKAIT